MSVSRKESRSDGAPVISGDFDDRISVCPAVILIRVETTEADIAGLSSLEWLEDVAGTLAGGIGLDRP